MVIWYNNAVLAWWRSLTGVVPVYINRTERKAYSSCIPSKMLLTLLFVASFRLLCLADAGNNEQTNMMTKVDLLKSIIYDNTKATVTLDSTALKQLIQLSAGYYIHFCQNLIFWVIESMLIWLCPFQIQM